MKRSDFTEEELFGSSAAQAEAGDPAWQLRQEAAQCERDFKRQLRTAPTESTAVCAARKLARDRLASPMAPPLASSRILPAVAAAAATATAAAAAIVSA